MSSRFFLTARRCAIQKFQGFAANSNRKPKVEPKFTQSAAFQGKGASGFRSLPGAQLDYYSSDSYNNKKIFSALGSLLVLIVYFGWLREPSDLDEIWNAPPHVLTANLERKMLREQIKDAESKGKDTTLLRAQLEYVDVKEEALRIQFDQKNKKK
ncbi:unnamed protein product [Caenorhabditis bovis]|uniref:Uncharacterized protein n=1 Tax=Caenorhabditis bovis TaxID=2654633 RepID=A0A8S1F0C5_9PELO|nr:unnamed protein product [Caenorhabditis bovis]